MKVLRLTHISGGGTYCIYDATNCPALLEEITEMQHSEVGEEWGIEVEEMPKEQFDNLPEFIGW